MSKQLPILPDEMRKPGTLTFQEILSTLIRNL